MDQHTKSGLPNSISHTLTANYIQLSKRTMDVCIVAVTGGNVTGYYFLFKGFYGLADIPTILLEEIDQTLDTKHPAWLEDMIVVTKCSKQKHMDDLIDVISRLQNADYQSNSKLFKTEK